ncbi:MAG: hypothetical protein E6I06_14650 [Chloroflexi bacterium]|nr:MAG: hypothetical protein E6I06_14650 [Chloroflexota bacterium]
MILRRLYLYLVSAAAMVLLAVGLVFLGATVLLFAFNDPSAESSRSQLAVFTAMTVVALPVWGVHFWVARRFAMRDPFERASALRRLYLYFVCLATALAAMETLAFALFFLFQPVFDQLPLNGLTAAQLVWASVICVALLGFHFVIASRDRAAVGEEGASATLRRWYMYVALLVGLLTMLSSAAYLLQLGWTKLVLGSIDQYLYMATPAGSVIAGALLWGFHARAIATNHISDDRHSTLRALEGFIAVAFSIGAALFGATQILYYALDRALGVSNPGGAGTNLLAALAGPGSLLLVYGVAWFLIRRRLARDARTQEADRQAGVRRLYTNLAALISLGAMAYGAAVLLATLLVAAEAPVIGIKAPDWKDPASLSLTLLLVGAAVWLAHWRQAPWAADRQSLSRKLYVWAALLGSVLAVIGGGVGLINALLQQVFSAHPNLTDENNLNFGRFLALIVVAAAIGVYHWRVLRSDAATRPPKVTAQPAILPATVAVVAQTTHEDAAPTAQVVGPHSRRYTLVVTDATEDDVHQALASLPPQANYHLTPTEQTVDGH